MIVISILLVIIFLLCGYVKFMLWEWLAERDGEGG